MSEHWPLLMLNDTSSPFDEVADRSKSGSPYVLSSRAAKAIVCSALLIVNVLTTSGAGL
jgi:hypothetical protein